MSTLMWIRAIVVLVGFAAALTYFILYLRNPYRKKDYISNLMLHFGVFQVLLYTNGILRLWVYPMNGDAQRPFIAQILLALTSAGALSLTLWVLVAYISVQRSAHRLRSHGVDDFH